MPAGSDPTRQVSRNQFIAILAAVALAFAAVSAWLWRAPLYGEDPMIVSWLRDGGVREALLDFSRPMYGLSSVRFYRPLVSLSIALQAAVSADAMWLRAANLAVFFLGIASVGAITRRLGAGLLGILFVGIWLVAFPGGPGDWCWIVGRVDAFSFGFGFLGLALLVAGDAAPSWGRAAAAGGALFAATLSKESAIAFAPAAPLLAAAIHGRAAIPRALAASLFVGFAWVLRAFALEFTSGGYVGAPASLSTWLQGLRLESLSGAAAVVAGFPAGGALGMLAIAFVVLPFVVLVSARRGAPRSSAWALVACAGCFAAPSLVGMGSGGVEPVHARLFPTFYATLGLAWALALDAIPLGSLPGKLGFRAAAAALLLALPAAGAVRSITNYREAAGRLARDFDAIQVARRARPDEPILAFAGAYQGWPDGGAHAFLYNLGLPERFAPPFAPPGPAVWPLRPALPALASEALAIPRDTPWIVVRDAPHAGVRLLDGETPAVIREGVELPSSLSGGDARAMAAGTLDRPIRIPEGPPGAKPFAVLFTNVGFARAPIDSAEGSWKRLLLAQVAGARIPLYQVIGFAADYHARRFFLLFQWIDAAGGLVAQTPLFEVSLAPDFADFIRESEADAAFGIRRAAAPPVSRPR
jgi:hypothetical protein